MKKLRSRLFMHFGIQFISIAILMIIIVLITFFIAILWVSKEEQESNYYQSKVEEISYYIEGYPGGIGSNQDLKDIIHENDWIQIIDKHGEVVDAVNTPENIPNNYSRLDLLKMRDTNHYDGYSLAFYLETIYEDDYLIVLGYEDRGKVLLSELLEKYNTNGKVTDGDRLAVEEKVEQDAGVLEIYDKDEKLIVRLGDGVQEEMLPLDSFSREATPDRFATKQYIFLDQETGNTWILHIPNNNKNEQSFPIIQRVLLAFIITGSIVLITTIIISVWNGFRYGNPLFIFTNWLGRMGNGDNEEVLTEREKKQIYRKNGKIRWRYRLYKEVFQAFYNMAEKLDVSRKEREQLEKSREEWIAGISHDLRTPLTTMEGYGRLLENDKYGWSKPELQEIGKTIYEKSNYMVDLIEDFTLSFQLKNDAAGILVDYVEMNTLIERMLEKFHKDFAFKDYSISFEPIPEEKHAGINPRLFERMIDNLIYNAWKHNPPGTSIKVELREARKQNGLEIRIHDDGTGMDEETQKHLFTRYYRGTNTEERNEGTGLGMSIALQIVKLHQGTISVESEHGKGTTVSVFFPYQRN